VRLGDQRPQDVFVKSAEDTMLRKLLWFRLGGDVSDRQLQDVRGIVKVQGPSRFRATFRNFRMSRGRTRLRFHQSTWAPPALRGRSPPEAHVLPLTDDQVRAFFDDGFVVFPDLFSEHEVARMRAAFNRLERTASTLEGTTMVRGSQFVVERIGENEPRVRIHRIVWCGAAEPVLLEFGRDPRLVAIAAHLLGSESMCQLINQAHFKLPGDGVQFPWHQDSTHRRYGSDLWRDVNGRGSYVQTMTAIDDVTAENGPLEFVLGSSRFGHLDFPGDGMLPAALAASPIRTPTLGAGGVIAFGPYTAHRSLPNNSARPRRTFMNGYAFPGANSRVYPGDGAGRIVRAERAAS
jgi:ectoine hydroxylase-related dioxygenase (phytanoyl-CoA dioxygenase family)